MPRNSHPGADRPPQRGAAALGRDDRGVSTTLGYVLNVAVATLLVMGLLIAGGDVVADERERTTRAELQVVGQQIAADLAAADRLVVDLDEDDTLRYERTLPATVAGSQYTVEVVGTPDPGLVLSTDDPDVTVRVELVLEAELVPTTLAGGDLDVAWADPDGDSANELEVRDG